jgi:hypothetical protein
VSLKQTARFGDLLAFESFDNLPMFFGGLTKALRVASAPRITFNVELQTLDGANYPR